MLLRLHHLTTAASGNTALNKKTHSCGSKASHVGGDCVVDKG